MDDVRDLLKSALGEARPAASSFIDTQQRIRRRERTRRITAALVAFAVFGGAAAFALSSFERHSRQLPLPGSDVSTPVAISAHVGATLDLGGCPIDMAAGLGASWISLGCQGVHDPAPGELVRVDAATGRIDRILDTGPQSVAVAAGSVWADVVEGSRSSIVRIDPTTYATTNVNVDGVLALAGDETDLWAMVNSGDRATAVERIDPATGQVLGSSALDVSDILPPNLSPAIVGFRVGEGAAWVLVLGINAGGLAPDGFLVRIGTDPYQVTGVVSVGHTNTFAVGYGAVWTEKAGVGAVRIDATTLDVEHLSLHQFEPQFWPFAVTQEGVWFLTAGNGNGLAVALYNTSSGSVDLSVSEPSSPATVGLNPDLDPLSHTIWVPDDDHDRVTRVDIEGGPPNA